MDHGSKTCGLLNQSNNCYANSILQILARLPGVKESLAIQGHEASTCYCINCILLSTVTRMLQENLTEPFYPIRFLNWLREQGKGTRFNEGEQSDPNEAIQEIFLKSNFVPVKHEEIAMTFCSDCPDAELEYETVHLPEYGIQVPMQSIPFQCHSIQDLIDFYHERPCDIRCEKCRRSKRKQITIVTPPQVLMIFLYRNEMTEGGEITKNMKHCTANEFIQFTADEGVSAKYRLVGTIHHQGRSVDEGHYVAKVKINQILWVYSDDELREERRTDGELVLAFYQKDDSIPETEFESRPTEHANEPSDFVITEAETDAMSSADKMKEFNERYSELYKTILLKHTRLLIMCIPKIIPGNSFKEKYKNFLLTEHTILYALTYRKSNFEYNIKRDPFLISNYCIYMKKITSKLGVYNTREWIAKAAVAWIIHSLLYRGGPRLEFIFDLKNNSLIPVSIITYWQTCKRNVIGSLTRLLENPLFCLETCTEVCLSDNDSFHFCLNEMREVKPSGHLNQQTRIMLWTFVENEDAIKHHKLEQLLSPMNIDNTMDIQPQVVAKIDECDFFEEKESYTYMLLVVNNASRHRPESLLDLWLSKTAEFGIYVGCTNSGPYRKDHLQSVKNGGATSVSKFLNETSTVYLVLSKEFRKRRDAERAEAILIAVLKQQEMRELKTGISKGFTLLNVTNPYYPIYSSQGIYRKAIKQFLDSEERLFIFYGEAAINPVPETLGGLLQSHIVNKVIFSSNDAV